MALIMQIENIKEAINTLNEVIDVSGSKVLIQDGQVKTILNERIHKSGYMTIEEAKQLTLEKIKKIYQQRNAL